MNTLASILAGIPGNPYQGAGGGIAPFLQQAMLAQHQGGAPGANPQGINPMTAAAQMNPRMAADSNGIGSLAQLALPGLATGAY